MTVPETTSKKYLKWTHAPCVWCVIYIICPSFNFDHFLREKGWIQYLSCAFVSLFLSPALQHVVFKDSRATKNPVCSLAEGQRWLSQVRVTQVNGQKKDICVHMSRRKRGTTAVWRPAALLFSVWALLVAGMLCRSDGAAGYYHLSSLF